MRVNKLYIKHFKGIQEIEIYGSNVVEICGPNGSGKSTVLDAIVAALGGPRKSNDVKPLRNGTRRGEVEVDLGDLIVTRKFSERKSTLTIQAKDGSKWNQSGLDNLIQSLSFDPLAFVREKDKKKQVKMIRNLCPEVSASMDGIDTQISESERKRELLFREISRFGRIDPVEKVEPVDISAVASELELASLHNSEQREKKMAIERQRHELSATQNELKSLADQYHRLKKVYSQKGADIEQLPKPKSEINTAELQQKIVNASAINERAQLYIENQKRIKAKKIVEVERQQIVDFIDGLKTSKKRILEKAQLPVPGLAWDEDGITVNGIPIEQLSSGEQITLSAQILMSTHPDLRIMLIRDGTLLDEKRFHELVSTACDAGYQVWVERVGHHAFTNEAIELSDGLEVERE